MKYLPLFLLGFLSIILHSCKSSSSDEKAMNEVEKRVEDMIVSEELISELTPRLKVLADEIKEKRDFANHCFESLGLSENEKFDLQTSFKQELDEYPEYVKVFKWTISDRIKSGEHPWRQLNELAVKWEHAKFGVVKGSFKDDSTFVMETVFGGKIHDENGSVISVNAHQLLTWKKEKGDWALALWEQGDFRLTRIKQQAFEEVLDEAIPDKFILNILRRSLHQELISEGLYSGNIGVKKAHYAELLDVECGFQYPSVSSVDYNGDGWDDLFVSSRWGAAQLLENQKNGTFKDVTAQSGLLIEGFINCALFIDLDNDGDKDLFLARTQEPSLFYYNEGGRYINKTKELGLDQDYHLVVSATATDINNDGLLDLYLCTYGPAGDVRKGWLDRYLPMSDKSALKQRLLTKDRYLNMPGPRNVLLLNKGGDKFARAELSKEFDIWRNSYQAVWADVDQDGDQDVYICNDFSPDRFFRNDTVVGSDKPIFKDVSEELFGSSLMGFGMGASWGDYDNDGDLDLYVSNMYSKAGKRIIGKLESVSDRIKVSAAGNFLYENQKGKFKQIAGSGKDQQHVYKVGWSFGGQFCDFDNDGKLDIYVPSGYYTAPSNVASNKDL